MTETRPTYHTLRGRIADGTRVAYPGSTLEAIAEAMDDLKAEAPEAYARIETVHQAIDEVLFGMVAPEKLLQWLMQPMIADEL